MQDKIKAIIASLAAEAAENKSKAIKVQTLVHHDLDISFLAPLFSYEQSSRGTHYFKKVLKGVNLGKRIVKRAWNVLRYPFSRSKIPYKRDGRITITNYVIAVPHFSMNDAVCNDALMLRKCLREAGKDAHIFAHTCDKGLQRELIRVAKFKSLLRSPKTLLIYNHCVYWPSGTEFIAKAQGPVWFRYHNVTPPEFFAPYDSISAFATRMGREQTEEIVKNLDSKIDLYIPVSRYNSKELQSLGANAEKFATLPPFHKLEEFENCEVRTDLMDELTDGKLNILFVGRIVPNKGFEKLLETVHKYTQNYNSQIRLIFAGGLCENFKPYYKQLIRKINDYKLSNIVCWTGKVSFDDLHTYYAFSDIFLLLSEHEGFCLPILEAQLHKLPILAVEGTAIRDTMGEGQMCIPQFDPDTLAAALHRIYSDKELRESLVQAGNRNLKKYTTDQLKASLASIVKEHV